MRGLPCQSTKELRRAQTRPFVVPSIGVEQQFLFMFRVENVGSTPAFNVHLGFDPPPQSQMKEIDDLRMLKEPIPTMPPNHAFRAYWESSLTVFNDKEPYPYPLAYRVRVTYEDLHGHRYGPEEYILDFGIYQGQATGAKGIGELVKAVEKIGAEHKKWTDGIKGLRVNTVDAIKKERRDHRPFHWRRMSQAYKSGGFNRAIAYWLDVWRRRHGLWSR